MTESNQHANVFVALAAAQAEMGSAKKSATNPHFKSRYADLSEVVDAAKPALTANGIAFYSFVRKTGEQYEMVTVLSHGASGTSTDCAVPLLVAQNNMQGFGSAMTYGRRYGLMSLTGLAPDDDDGNSACGNGATANAAMQRPRAPMNRPAFLNPPQRREGPTEEERAIADKVNATPPRPAPNMASKTAHITRLTNLALEANVSSHDLTAALSTLAGKDIEIQKLTERSLVHFTSDHGWQTVLDTVQKIRDEAGDREEAA